MSLNILGIIPARGGSKGVPRKNLRLLAGKPLLSYAIDEAKKSLRLNQFLVSTDDEEIATIAKQEGAWVPFLRPSELAEDDSTALSVIKHAVNFYENDTQRQVDIAVYLQPTSPMRNSEDIDSSIELCISSKADQVVSVVEVEHRYSPNSLLVLKDGYLTSALSIADEAKLLRQLKPKYYARNGPAVLVLSRKAVEKGSLYEGRTVPYIMPVERSLDIDSEFDFKLAEFLFSRSCGYVHE